MCALKLVADTIPRVTDRTFKRKYIALGRIVTQWKEIMGDKMAGVAQPLKIRYRKPRRKGDKPEATLEIAVSSAQASLLMMQKGVLLEKINHIFGERWITDIKFIHNPTSPLPKKRENQKDFVRREKNSSI